MSKIDDGGPAFPCVEETGETIEHVELDMRTVTTEPVYVRHNGMTLRDWFAGQVQFAPDEPSVFQAKAVMKEGPPSWPPFSESNDYERMETCIRWWATARARLRLIEADAMLAARKEPQPAPRPCDCRELVARLTECVEALASRRVFPHFLRDIIRDARGGGA